MLLRRRLLGLVAAIALASGQLGLCAGWSSSPEARHACCTQGACAMHTTQEDLADDPTRTTGGTTAHHAVDQSEADRCCGLSEQRDDPAPSAASVAPVVPLVLLTAPVALVVEPDAARRDNHGPHRSGAVPRHLLLSVLLV